MVVKQTAKLGQLTGVHIQIDGQHIEEVDRAVYLGSMIKNEMRNIIEIKLCIARAKNQVFKLGRFLTNKKSNIMTRKRIVDCYVHSTLMCKAEMWTMTKDASKRLDACGMWCYRRLLKLSWMRKSSNERVLAVAEDEKKVVRTIKDRKLKYYGHVIRHQGSQKDALTWTIEGRRSRGRQRWTWIDDVNEWSRLTTSEIRTRAQDRKGWRELVHDLWNPKM